MSIVSIITKVCLFISTGLQDSGFHSLSSGSSRPATPLTTFEMSALKVAIETIPETDELRNTSVQQETQRKTRSSSLGAQETACDWRSVREITRRIAPDSRSTLRAIDDLFYAHTGENKQKQNKFSPSRRKEMTAREKFHRW